MTNKLQRGLTISAILVGVFAMTSRSSSEAAPPGWSKLEVTLPASTELFPAGEGAAIANSQCVICHSADMVLTQPRRTQQQWVETINKMRTVYGAPVSSDQVDPLAAYFARVVASE